VNETHRRLVVNMRILHLNEDPDLTGYRLALESEPISNLKIFPHRNPNYSTASAQIGSCVATMQPSSTLSLRSSISPANPTEVAPHYRNRRAVSRPESDRRQL
jgi:hypothetical protein